MKNAILLLALAGMTFADEASRTWTNSEGKTVSGILKRKSSTTVDVLLAGGKSATLEIAKLSKADQDYIAAAQMFPQLKMVARTAKAKSNEAGSQMDSRAELPVSGTITRLLSIVTAPVSARARPAREAPVLRVMDSWARMEPSNWEPTPSVAELPTCQNILEALAPLIRFTLLPTLVINVVPVWKIQTAFGSPPASSVSVPVRKKELGLV